MSNIVPNKPSPIHKLDRNAIHMLLEEGISTEYCMVVHNRQVMTIESGLWNYVIPKSTKTLASQLRSLDLSFNELSHISPHTLAPLSELRDLKLYSNSFTDEGLLECGLEKLTRLENLELHDNQLVEPPKQLVSGTAASVKLLSLRMERNRLENLRGLGKCRALTTLSVDGNRLHSLTESDGSGWLFACQSLKNFTCCDNDINRLTTKSFAGCPNLTDLALSRNCLDERSLKALSSLEVLRRLKLDGNHLVSLVNMPALKKLEELYVSSNRLCAGALDSIATSLPALEILDIASNRLDGESCVDVIGKPLKELKGLCELSCEENPCTSRDNYNIWWGQLAASLGQLQLLEERKVSKTEGGVAMPPLSLSPRPLSARPLSARPSSARGRLSPRPSVGGASPPLEGLSRPVMHPPSARTGYGTDLKVDSLEDVEALAQGFRAKVNIARASLNLRPKTRGQDSENRNQTRLQLENSKIEKTSLFVSNQHEGESEPISDQKKLSFKEKSITAKSSFKVEAETEAPDKPLESKQAKSSRDGVTRGLFTNQQPPPPPRLLKPWEKQEIEPRAEPKVGVSVNDSDRKVPSVDFSTLRVSSGDKSLDIPQPSPRFQRETSVVRKDAPTQLEKKSSLRKFNIPAKARQQLATLN